MEHELNKNKESGKRSFFDLARENLQQFPERMGQGTCPRVPYCCGAEFTSFHFGEFVYNESIEPKTGSVCAPVHGGICIDRIYKRDGCGYDGNIRYSGKQRNSGIGFEIFMPQGALAQIRIGKEYKLHTYFHVKEDDMQLYGFFTKDDLQVFRLLLQVNGIGPKGALGVLSGLTADELRFAKKDSPETDPGVKRQVESAGCL